jgi:hypothetical protein
MVVQQKCPAVVWYWRRETGSSGVLQQDFLPKFRKTDKIHSMSLNTSPKVANRAAAAMQAAALSLAVAAFSTHD